jgi:hypothetical protein
MSRRACSKINLGGEGAELERELPREIWTKLTYWKTEQVVAPSRLKRLPEEEDE